MDDELRKMLIQLMEGQEALRLEFKKEISEVREEIKEIREEVKEVREEVKEVREEVKEVREEVKKIKATIEGEIKPKIEALQDGYKQIMK